MTPQLQQAIKLLQLSNIELSAFVETELERNPLLEREEGERGDDGGDSTGDRNDTEPPGSAPAGAVASDVALTAPEPPGVVVGRRAARHRLEQPVHRVQQHRPQRRLRRRGAVRRRRARPDGFRRRPARARGDAGRAAEPARPPAEPDRDRVLRPGRPADRGAAGRPAGGDRLSRRHGRGGGGRPRLPARAGRGGAAPLPAARPARHLRPQPVGMPGASSWPSATAWTRRCARCSTISTCWPGATWPR